MPVYSNYFVNGNQHFFYLHTTKAKIKMVSKIKIELNKNNIMRIELKNYKHSSQ